MDLFLVPDNPLRTVLVSANRVAHYRISTHKSHGRQVTIIERPAESKADSIVAEIDWRTHHWEAATTVKSKHLPPMSTSSGKMLATEFLYKHGSFSSSRYFLGNDNLEYQWKTTKTTGCVLTLSGKNEELAKYVYTSTHEGLYAGERKTRLRIQPLCSLDLDLVVISFIVMEKKRRDHVGQDARLEHDEDPAGDGAGDGGA